MRGIRPPLGGLVTQSASPRQVTALDAAISHFDSALRTLFGSGSAYRSNPAKDIVETVTPKEKRHVAGLMRVNHSGEVAAQALYSGQAATAASTSTRESMIAAAHDETDHLAWCAERIHELGSHRSVLNPIWYGGSFAIGAISGFFGDRVSLGFVAETEKQVVQHLESQLQKLPHEDARTRAIIEKMREDEARHGNDAANAGGIALPTPIRSLMSLTSKIMTTTAYRI
jgi:3-demethoxyubiquinol 3-hydroxylase